MGVETDLGQNTLRHLEPDELVAHITGTESKIVLEAHIEWLVQGEAS